MDRYVLEKIAIPKNICPSDLGALRCLEDREKVKGAVIAKICR